MFNPSENVSRGKTEVVALDCEMVGVVGDKNNGEVSALARLTIVNYHGHVLMDKFVCPEKRVVDYRSFVSGVYPENLEKANGAM